MIFNNQSLYPEIIEECSKEIFFTTNFFMPSIDNDGSFRYYPTNEGILNEPSKTMAWMNKLRNIYIEEQIKKMPRRKT